MPAIEILKRQANTLDQHIDRLIIQRKEYVEAITTFDNSIKDLQKERDDLEQAIVRLQDPRI